MTIFIRCETKTHILPTKINENNSLRSASLTIIVLFYNSPFNNNDNTTTKTTQQHNKTHHIAHRTSQHNTTHPTPHPHFLCSSDTLHCDWTTPLTSSAQVQAHFVPSGMRLVHRYTWTNCFCMKREIRQPTNGPYEKREKDRQSESLPETRPCALSKRSACGVKTVSHKTWTFWRDTLSVLKVHTGTFWMYGLSVCLSFSSDLHLSVHLHLSSTDTHHHHHQTFSLKAWPFPALPARANVERSACGWSRWCLCCKAEAGATTQAVLAPWTPERRNGFGSNPAPLCS